MTANCRFVPVLLTLASALACAVGMLGMPSAYAQEPRSFKLKPPLHIQEQGSLSAGAQILKNAGADGGEFHADYLYSNYQVPQGAKKNSLVMWHGCLGAAWERRPDGRGPGFSTLMVQRKWPVFVLDQPRISRGARGLGEYGPFPEITSGSDCASMETFRYGTWNPPAQREFFPNVQLALDQESVDALCQLSGSPGGPNLGQHALYPDDPRVDAVVALLDRKAGESVLVTHSNSGQMGWLARIKSDKVKGIYNYEGATYVFPDNDPPPAIPTSDPSVAAIDDPILVPEDEFMKLTEIPIRIVFGDNIEFDTPSSEFGVELWRVVAQRVQHFQEAVNSRGGDVEVLFLPDIGVFGNTHFPFFDLNNEEIADLQDEWLKKKGLAK